MPSRAEPTAKTDANDAAVVSNPADNRHHASPMLCRYHTSTKHQNRPESQNFTMTDCLYS
jgi:hypothetical protein